MRLDLTSLPEYVNIPAQPEEENYDSYCNQVTHIGARRWIALPQSLRLSTRPRPPLNPDGSRPRSFARISKSGTMPTFAANLALSVESLAERLVEEALMPLFRKLHPEKCGWDLSLVNICATNMSLIASDDKHRAGRDIGKMFSKQEGVLKEWKIDDFGITPRFYGDEENRLEHIPEQQEIKAVDSPSRGCGLELQPSSTQESLKEDDTWNSEDDFRNLGDTCRVCGTSIPPYAKIAHVRFHALPD